MTIKRMDHVGGWRARGGRRVVGSTASSGSTASGSRSHMRTPDGHGQVELTNIGVLDQNEDSDRLCFVRGPQGVIIALSEQVSSSVRSTS